VARCQRRAGSAPRKNLLCIIICRNGMKYAFGILIRRIECYVALRADLWEVSENGTCVAASRRVAYLMGCDWILWKLRFPSNFAKYSALSSLSFYSHIKNVASFSKSWSHFSETFCNVVKGSGKPLITCWSQNPCKKSFLLTHNSPKYLEWNLA